MGIMNRLERFIKEGGYSYDIEMLPPSGKTPRYLLTIKDKQFVVKKVKYNIICIHSRKF